jgi:hypothetical protein
VTPNAQPLYAELQFFSLQNQPAPWHAKTEGDIDLKKLMEWGKESQNPDLARLAADWGEPTLVNEAIETGDKSLLLGAVEVRVLNGGQVGDRASRSLDAYRYTGKYEGSRR